MLRLLAVLTLAAGTLVASAEPARALTGQDLIGTWYVLSHYKDTGTDHPDRERWVDRVWEFEMEGDKLKWTDYAIVVFQDETGRFEKLGTNRQSRVLSFWNPSPDQMADIADGLEVNKRGAKTKALKPVAGGDWSSAGRARPQSMKMISYVETWTIKNLASDLAIFERSDSLSSGMTETLDGVTRYTSESFSGGEFRGLYERDGTQEGTFRMIPSLGTSWVKGSGKTQGQRLTEAWFGGLSAGMVSEDALNEEVQRMIADGDVDDETRKEIRRAIRDGLASQMRQQGQSPSKNRAILDSLTDQVERLMIDDKKTEAEITEMFQKGEIRP